MQLQGAENLKRIFDETSNATTRITNEEATEIEIETGRVTETLGDK